MIYNKPTKRQIEKLLDKRNRRALKVYGKIVDLYVRFCTNGFLPFDKSQIKKRNSFISKVKNVIGSFGR